MLQEPINSENVYFNATQIAKMYDKKVINFLRLEGTDEYISQIESHFKGDLKTPLKKTIRGKYHSGTWLHKELMIKFISWCDVKLEFAMHQIIKEIITHSNELKIERDNTKILFKDLTKSIKNHYIPNQESDNAKKFAYSNISGLVNIKVLGSTASKYAKDNNIEVEQGKSVRDYLNKEQLEQIEEQERIVSGLIEFASISDYEELKAKL